METLDQIALEAEVGNMLPARAADLLVVLAGKYSRAADNYIVKSAEYAKAFTEERDNFKSDTATERHLDYTELGLEVKHWKYQMKKAETLIKSLNGYIYQKTAEAKNEM